MWVLRICTTMCLSSYVRDWKNSKHLHRTCTGLPACRWLQTGTLGCTQSLLQLRLTFDRRRLCGKGKLTLGLFAVVLDVLCAIQFVDRSDQSHSFRNPNMPRPSEDFKAGLTAELTAKSDNRQLVLFDGLQDKLLELLMGLFDQCLGQLSPAEVAQRVSQPSEATRIRFRTRVRQNLYKSAKDYSEQGGKNVADSVLETTIVMGQEKCVALVKELTEGENWFPNDDLFMGG